MLSDAPKRQKAPSGKRRAIGAKTNKNWSDSQKIEAVTTYLALGNLALTSRVLNIPEMTLRTWKAKEWWKEIQDELQVMEELQLSARMKKVIEASMSAVEDRLTNGDWIYDNKNGCLMRKPVNLRDVHKVAMDMIDKREHIIEKVAAPSNVNMEQIDDRLKKLAEKFEQIAAERKQMVIEVTDVIEVPVDGEHSTA
jgi:transposase-like protein